MSTQSSFICEPISVTSHYRGLCCPYCVNRKQWSNKRKRPKNSKRTTLRSYRTGARK